MQVANTHAKIKEMVEHQTNKYSWEFIFMGANIDAFDVGQSIGIGATNSFNYSNTSRSTQAVYSSISDSITNSRLYGGSVSATINPADLIDNTDTSTDSKSNN